MLIQILLLIGAVGLLIVFVRRQHGVRMQASKRIAFAVFLAVNVYAVLRPDDVTAVANAVGVGRGTDLVLYLLVVAFIFVILNFFLRFRHMDARLTQLARAVAIRDAELLNRERGLLPPVAEAPSVPPASAPTPAPAPEPAPAPAPAPAATRRTA